jgi:DNA-binding beta-propeller fold protein YncE
LIRRLSGGRYGFNDPDFVNDDGKHVWVANYRGNSVTEFNDSDGSWIRTISDGPYNFRYPARIIAGVNVMWVINWVTPDASPFNPALATITEINTGDGSFIRNLADGEYGFYTPYQIGMAGGADLYAANTGMASHRHEGSLTRFNARNGRLVRVLPLGNPPSGVS